jgi:hypothetical protein
MLTIILSLLLLTVSSLRAEQDCAYIACHTRPCERASKRHDHIFDADATSTNWSGYVAALSLAGPIPLSASSVSGSWIVPNIQPSSMDTSCSIWVGIDGAGSPSVEQIGTEHDYKNGQQSHYAWFEMFPLPSQELVGFPVNVGDTITASVVYIPVGNVLPATSDLYILTLTNNTKKLYTSIPYITTTNMERVCVEWIIEAPWLNVTLPLSNFGVAHMFNCMAVIGNVSGPINSPKWSNERMSMISAAGVSQAVASILDAGGESFSVQWQHN